MRTINHICMLGLGEVGSILATDLARISGLRFTAWDREFAEPASKPSRHAVDRPFLRRAIDAESAAEECDLVISAVTAAQALPAARSILPSLAAGAWYLDLNSISPQAKRNVGATIEAAGARFVEAAVMSPIAPRRSTSPILAGGPHADVFLPLAQALGFTGMRHFSAEIGRAAATKMCRSVVVKGMEALLTEALLAARHHGVETQLIDSLGEMFPHPDWNLHARYMISRSLEHGVRRAEEMREAALTVAEAGIEPMMSDACARRQDWTARLAPALEHDELATMLDSMLEMNQVRSVKSGLAEPGK